MLTIIFTDENSNPYGITKEEFEKLEIKPLRVPIKINILEKELNFLKDYPIPYISEEPEEGLHDLTIMGVDKICGLLIWINEFERKEGSIKYDKDKLSVPICRFITGKTLCTNRENPVLCNKRKSLGECPIEKGIPGGSARDIWGAYLDNGGDKNIEVTKFLEFKLSDLSEAILKRLR